MTTPTLTWEAICADRSLRDLPYKIETNRFNQIIMSPASNWHSRFEVRIAVRLDRLLQDGETFTECAIQTTDGIRVADVAWMTKTKHRPYRKAVNLPIAPDICVEILSYSNSDEEMQEKMDLYFKAGAQEVWFCNDDGVMQFFTAASAPQPVEKSVLCPDFPRQIDTD